jgi:hypothetical protein
MKILFVVATAMEAEYLRRQVPDKKVAVVSPGQRFGSRFDLIFVTDQYRREQCYASEIMRETNHRWFRESVETRLSGPEARIVHL